MLTNLCYLKCIQFWTNLSARWCKCCIVCVRTVPLATPFLFSSSPLHISSPWTLARLEFMGAFYFNFSSPSCKFVENGDERETRNPRGYTHSSWMWFFSPTLGLVGHPYSNASLLLGLKMGRENLSAKNKQQKTLKYEFLWWNLHAPKQH